jgi:hypothetical protein
MSPDVEDAIIGKVVRERHTARRALAVLETEVSQVCAKLGKLVRLLERNAHLVWIAKASTNERYLNERLNDYMAEKLPEFQLSDIDGKRIADLTSRLRDAIDEVERLDKEAVKYGL